MTSRSLIIVSLMGMGLAAGGVGCGDGASNAAGVGGTYDSGTGGGWDGSGGGFTGTGTDTSDEPTSDVVSQNPDKEPPTSCDGLDTTKPLILYLSADDSNSMGSPVHSRELLRMGDFPSAIRTYEFLNYYRIDYPAPPFGELNLFAEAETGENPGEIDLQLAVRSFDAVTPRRPMTITFVLDTSGSMGGEPIERERATVSAIAASLADGDIVNMVTWNTGNNVVLDGYAVTGPNDTTVLNAAKQLVADGGTDLHSGLVKGYDLANKNYDPGKLNRVVLISDGGANVGITDKDLIALNSEDADKEGIYMVGVGVGPAYGYYDSLMDTVTDKGRGAYVYLDSVDEAQAMFIDRFDETMEVAARSVQVELTLPWYFQIQKFYGEEYSENPEEVEPQHLAPSDAMIFNQVLKACDPAVVNDADPITLRVNWKTPITYEAKATTIDTTVGDLLNGPKDHLPKGKAIIAYAEALKTGAQEDLHSALEKVIAANVNGNDPELSEIEKLIPLHPNY